MLREDGRANDELRKCRITRNINKYAEGSCLITLGQTRVHCTASVEDRQPPFLRDSSEGWVTAEYSMLPRATAERTRRETDRGISGRTHEIQRLIGRSLRAVTDTKLLGPLTVQIDCDVLQADGGTRCASITGACVALHEACNKLVAAGKLATSPMRDFVAAVSVGIFEGTPVLDLDYDEDSTCDTDMNVVMTGSGGLVEVQGTAEGAPFSRAEMEALLDLATAGLSTIISAQKQALSA